jgi:hypothetical protein
MKKTENLRSKQETLAKVKKKLKLVCDEHRELGANGMWKGIASIFFLGKFPSVKGYS